MFFGNHLCFDELNASGHKVRMKNKMKARNLMMLAINFLDEGTLARIQEFLAGLDPEDMARFKAYLRQRGYLARGNEFARENKILDKIAALALTSLPEDAELQGIMRQYNENLEEIDRLKVLTTKTPEADILAELIARIHGLNEQNLGLLARIEDYRKRRYQPVEQAS